MTKDLKTRHGKGFSRSNLRQYMRLLYTCYPKRQTLSGKLSWSHYVELLSISDDAGRSFYEKQCIAENWSVTCVWDEWSGRIYGSSFMRASRSGCWGPDR